MCDVCVVINLVNVTFCWILEICDEHIRSRLLETESHLNGSVLISDDKEIGIDIISIRELYFNSF